MTANWSIAWITQDWARNRRLSRITVTALRINQAIRRTPQPARTLLLPVRAMAWVWMSILMGMDVPTIVPIGPGLRLPHGGRGVIVHPTARIGANATLYHRVTLGMRSGIWRAPTLEDDVYVGCGAIVLGGVTLGRACRVGAGAVVVDDVPPGATATSPRAKISAPRAG